MKYLTYSFLIATLAASPGAATAMDHGCDGCALKPFDLHYEVSRNGKALGEAQFSLRQSGDSLWTLEMRVEATKGLAGFAGYREVERSMLSADGDGWRVLSYERKRKVAFRNRDEEMRFDWATAKLSSERDGERQTVELTPGTVDSNSLTLLLGHQLRSSLALDTYPVARRGKIDRWRFTLAGEETVDGYRVQRVERIREDSKRTTTSWFSAAHDYLPIRLQQVEEDGETITMRLR